MASYLDSLSQNMSNSYTQLYRKPRYTQIGQGQFTSPTRISLNQMYGSTPTALPSLEAAVPTYQGLPTPTGPSGFGGQEQYFKQQGWTQQNGQWLPPGAQDFETYEDANKNRWIYADGRWHRLEQNQLEGPYQVSGDLLQQTVNTRVWNEGLVEQKGSLEQQLKDNATAQMQAQYDENPALQAKLARERVELQNQLNATNNRIKEITNQTEAELFGAAQAAPTIESWQEDLQTLMDNLDSDEWTLNEEGKVVDAEGNPVNSLMAGWFEKMASESYDVGSIAGQFYDENGNLAPELQDMMDFFNQSSITGQEMAQFNRDLAMSAISQGRSINSGYYSDYVADQVGNYAAGVTDQVLGAITGEMKGQWDYIANSLQGILKAAGQDIDTAQFNAAMETAKAQMLQEYNQQLQQLATAMAENKAASFGQIFTGILMAVLQIGLALII